MIPAFIGVSLAITSRGFPARYLSVIFLLLLFLTKLDKLEENEFEFYLLDVGPGLSGEDAQSLGKLLQMVAMG